MKLQILSSAVACCVLASSPSAQSCDPAFPGERSLPAAYGANAFALHDLNGDGREDVLTCEAWALRVSLALGGGRFGVPLPTSILNASRLLDVADWNADGVLDVAIDITTSSYGPLVRILLGNGDGTFADASTLATGPSLQSVTHGDLDGDGVADLLIGLYGAYQVAFGAGGGVFKTHALVAHGSVITSFLLGDLDQDGDLDAVGLSAGRAYFNDGFGQFGAPVAIVAASGAGFGQLADCDADGDLDLVAGRYSGAIQVLANDGLGGFTPASAVALNTYLLQFEAVDFDRDGSLDLVCLGYEPGRIFVLDGLPGGGFAAPVEFPITTPSSMAQLTDIDEDGALDVPFVSQLTYTAVYARGDGAGGFSSVRRSPFPTDARETSLGDFDGDGQVDLVAAASWPALCVALGGAGGSFTALAPITLPSWSNSVAVADVDSDGRDDVLATLGYVDSFALLQSIGPGVFASPVTYPTGDEPSDLVVRDFDRDGTLDVAVSMRTGVGLFSGSGNGSFMLAASYATTPRASSIASADVDGDGWLDLAVTSRIGNDITLLLGGAQGFQVQPTSWLAVFTPQQIEAADVTGEGWSDLLVASGAFDAIAVLRGDGQGGFATPQVHATSSPPTYWGSTFARFTLGDIDADGRTDLIYARPPLGDVGWARGDGAGNFTAGANALFLGDVHGVEGLDLDADGRLDLFGVVVDDAGAHLMVAEQLVSSPLRYCSAKTNSLGCVPTIAANGCPGLADGAPFWIEANAVLNQKLGLLFYGSARNASPFQGGTLCVAQPFQRSSVLHSGGNSGTHDCSGVLAFDFDAWANSGADPSLIAGSIVTAQFWYRDSQASFGAGLTDALEFALQP